MAIDVDAAILCKADPDLWVSEHSTWRAIKICETCPALEACREAIDLIEADGHAEWFVWAGETPGMRQKRRGQTYRRPRGQTNIYQPMPEKCRLCDRKLRRSGVKAADAPGTVLYETDGLCKSCSQRLKREGL